MSPFYCGENYLRFEILLEIYNQLNDISQKAVVCLRGSRFLLIY